MAMVRFDVVALDVVCTFNDAPEALLNAPLIVLAPHKFMMVPDELVKAPV